MVKDVQIEAFKQHIEKRGLTVKKIADSLGIPPDNLRQSLYRGTLNKVHFSSLSSITGMSEEILRKTFSVAKTRVAHDGKRKQSRDLNILPLIMKVAEIMPTDGVLSLGDFQKLMRVENEWGSPLNSEALRGLLFPKAL